MKLENPGMTMTIVEKEYMIMIRRVWTSCLAGVRVLVRQLIARRVDIGED
jgi:hypothetical protein